jgi:hypothetical protein
MFTWICPQCGREVPPAYNECPDCAAKTARGGGAAPPLPPAPPPAQPGGFGGYAQTPPAAAPPAYAPPPPAYAPPQAPAYAAPRAPHTSGVPTWLLTVLFAFAFLGLGVGIYWLVGAARGHGQTSPTTTVESPAAKAGANANPFQKFIEVSGVRFGEDPKHKEKIVVKFVLTNHAETEIPALSGNVTLWARPRKSEEDAQGTFGFTTSIGPFETKEVAAPLVTKLKIYELPDWQNLNPDLQITAPGATSGGSPAPR